MAIMPLKQDKCLSQVELLGMITSRIPAECSAISRKVLCLRYGKTDAGKK